MVDFGITYKFIVFPGFLFTLALGLALTWLDRKVSARFQWRVGPPWYQPLADILKLLGKQISLPEGSSTLLFVISPMIGLAGITLACTILWAVCLDPVNTFLGDLIVVLYLLILPSVGLVLGGFSSGSPFGTIGASRELKLILSYEVAYMIAVFTAAYKSGSILLGSIIGQQASHGMFMFYPSCFLAFIVSIFCIQAKMGAVPFDAAEAEQEIAGGALAEYSGSLLALFKITKAMMMATLPVLVMVLFMGRIDLSSWPGVINFAIKYVIIALLGTLIRNTNPRLRIDQITRFFWGPVLAVAVIGFILAALGA